MKKKTIIWIIVALAALAVALGTFLGISSLVRKRQKEERDESNRALLVAYYNDKVTAFEADNAERGHADIVFLGDSLTDGCDLSRWYPEYDCANRGIGGDTTSGVLKRLQVSVFDLSPSTVVMLIGGNNLDTMFEDYEQILQAFASEAPSMKVVLVSLTAMGGDFASKNALAIENNEKIKVLASAYNYSYVDIFSLMYDASTGSVKPELVVSDHVHLSDAGYELVSGEIKKALE